MKRSYSGRRNARVRSAASSAASVIPHPPPLLANVIHGRHIRFIATAAVTNVDISATNLLDLQFMATSAVAGYRTVASMRIRRVELWAPPGTTTPASCSIRWRSTTTSQATTQDQSIGATEPAHVVAKPPPGDLSFWIDGTTAIANVFRLNGPAGLIVDLHYTVSSADVIPALAVVRAVAGATAGTLYIGALDSGGASLLVPQGVNTV